MNLWKWILSLFAKQPKADPVPVPTPVPVPVPDKPTESAGTDALPVASVASCSHQGSVWPAWPVTYTIKATLKPGGKLVLAGPFNPPWPTVDNIVGCCWFIVRRSGAWRAYCWDYIRAGQKDRGFPWPEPGADWETVAPGEECYLVLTGLCRDKRRNVSARSNIVRVQ